MFVTLITQGLSLGFSAGSIPGPLHMYMVSETLLHGLRRSIIVAATPFIADIPLILLMVLVLNQLPDSVITTLKIAGGGYIWYLAIRNWQQTQHITEQPPEPSTRGFMLSRAILINWLNPAPYIFWGTVNGPLLVEGLEESALHGAGFLVAFYGSLCGMILLVGLVFNRLRHIQGDLTRWMLRASTVILGVLGTWLLLDGVAGLG